MNRSTVEKLRRLCGAVAVGMSVSACDTIQYVVESDLWHSGGVSGAFADKALRAATKETQLYRAAMGMALISGAGERTISNSDAAWDFVYANERVALQINKMQNLLTKYKDCAGMTKVCDEYPEMFEKRVPDLERRMFRLAVAALPRDKFRDLVDDLVSLNYIGAAFSLMKVTGAVLDSAHQGAATFRSSAEGLAQIVRRSGEKKDETIETIEQARTYINANFDKIQSGTLRLKLEKQDFDLLFKLSKESCEVIATRADIPGDAKNVCAKVAYPGN